MWLLYAFGSAVFAGLTAILAKVGVTTTPSHLATAIRTGVVLVFAWLVVFIVGSQQTITTLSGTTVFFLVLSGLATGLSWLCYFRALHLGDAASVAPVGVSGHPSRSLGRVRSRPIWPPPYQIGRSPLAGRLATE